MYVCMYALRVFLLSMLLCRERQEEGSAHGNGSRSMCTRVTYCSMYVCMYVYMYIGRYGILHPIIGEKLKTNKGKIFYFRTGRI